VVGVTAAMSAAVWAVLTTASGAVAVVSAVLLGVAVWAGLSVLSGLLEPRTVVTALS